MKVIISGCTGTIGKEVLNQCLQLPSITTVYALTRRELPASASSNPKLKTIIHKDFLSYPESILQQVSDADACIWALGLALPPKSGPSLRTINLEYTLAAANAFANSLAKQRSSTADKFRFVYVSGMLAVKDQEKPLWFAEEGRRMRGEIENELVALQKAHPETLETTVARPGMVLAKNTYLMGPLISTMHAVKVDELAALLVDCAMNGREEQIVDSAPVRAKGRIALKKFEGMER
ncbi:hypothetical protein MMC25_000886 [Agyrium rufum]|nr:hypothetical protein [Agyrium rufum]